MSSPVLAKPLFRDGKISKPSAVIPSEQCDGRKRTIVFELGTTILGNMFRDSLENIEM